MKKLHNQKYATIAFSFFLRRYLEFTGLALRMKVKIDTASREKSDIKNNFKDIIFIGYEKKFGYNRSLPVNKS